MKTVGEDKPKGFRNYIRTVSTKKLVVILVLLVVALALVQGLVWLALTYNSLKTGDLTLFVQAKDEYVALAHNKETDLEYTLGVNNLPFCEATCNWTITNLGSGTVVKQGTMQASGEQKETYTASIAAPATGRVTTPYQFAVSCNNQVSQYCSSEYTPRQAAAITIVEVTYTQDEQDAYEQLQEQLPTWLSQRTQQLTALAGIARMTDARIQTIAQQAKTEQTALETNAETLRTHAAADNPQEAYSALGQPVDTNALEQYTHAQQTEQTAAALYTEIAHQQETIQALNTIATPQDRTKLRQAAANAVSAYATFTKQPLEQSKAAFSALNNTVASLTRTYEPHAIEQATTAQSLLFAEQRMACTLNTAPCPPDETIEPQNITAAVEQLQTTCSDLAALNAYYAQAHVAYAEKLQPGTPAAQTEEDYNITAIRLQQDFAETAASIRAAARTGELDTTDPALRLAIPLVPAEETLAFIDEACNFTNTTITLPQIPLTPTLPASPQANETLPAIAFPHTQCCTTNECGTCTTEHHYPVIFVHGHSFTDASAPEYNLYAFTQMAFTLQQDGYVYAGHLFPREDLDDIPQGEYKNINAPVLFTATYYYDSYPEEGKTSFVVQKSEDLETYAIRLKEAVDVARHKTGEDKVVIVAHSMGGLVTRRYIQLFGEDRVAAVILIGTPNQGISDRTQSLCPIFGGDKECEDMTAGSVFLTKLNRAKAPSIPVYTIAGTGCDGRAFDGVVETQSVALSFANNTVVTGVCPSASVLLHSTMLNPAQYPGVYTQVRDLLNRYTR